jgi:hypothetical protein
MLNSRRGTVVLVAALLFASCTEPSVIFVLQNPCSRPLSFDSWAGPRGSEPDLTLPPLDTFVVDPGGERRIVAGAEIHDVWAVTEIGFTERFPPAPSGTERVVRPDPELCDVLPP